MSIVKFNVRRNMKLKNHVKCVSSDWKSVNFSDTMLMMLSIQLHDPIMTAGERSDTMLKQDVKSACDATLDDQCLTSLSHSGGVHMSPLCRTDVPDV